MAILHYTDYVVGAINDSTITAQEVAELALAQMGEEAVKAMVLAHGVLAQQSPTTLDDE